MPHARSFRRNVFRTVLLVALIPAAAGVITAALVVQGMGTGTGTLGPWDAVAESGRALIDASRSAAPGDPEIERLAQAHQEALSESVRQSRLYSLVATRALQLLPWVALLGLLVIAGLSALAAKRVSRRLGGPVGELVEWTRRIAEGESLPPAEEVRRPIKEFRALREALRTMESDLAQARRRELEAAQVRAWSDVARRVAHELKNPLTPIRMGAAALARNADPGVRDTGEMIAEEVARLDEMARNFSRFGRPPEGPSAPVDLAELLEGLVARHGNEPGGPEVSLEMEDELPLVEGHHDALARAVLNLLVNAREALGDRPEGQVRIGARRVPGGVEVTVADNGPGVPRAIRDDIWLPEVTTRSRGSGLGLAMVRQTVQAHGGEVSLALPAGGGASFGVFLPVTGPPTGSSSSPASASSPPTPPPSAPASEG